MTQVRIVRGRQAGAVALIAALAVAGCTSSGTHAVRARLGDRAGQPRRRSRRPRRARRPSRRRRPPRRRRRAEPPNPRPSRPTSTPASCITSDEASTFVGVNFGKGKATTTENNVKMCSYAAPGPNIFTVEVAVAPDVATAQAAEAAAKADLSSQGAKLGVEPLPSFADGTDAAILQGVGQQQWHLARRPRAVAPQGHDVRRVQRHLRRWWRSHRPSRRSRTRATRCSRSSPDGYGAATAPHWPWFSCIAVFAITCWSVPSRFMTKKSPQPSVDGLCENRIWVPSGDHVGWNVAWPFWSYS